jgi:hypothetical protein
MANENITQIIYKNNQVRSMDTATRLLYTAALGELIYDTDQTNLYVGDASTPGGILLADSNDNAATKLDKGGDVMNGQINMQSNKIVSLGTPTTANDAANKGYVDSQLQDKLDTGFFSQSLTFQVVNGVPRLGITGIGGNVLDLSVLLDDTLQELNFDGTNLTITGSNDTVDLSVLNVPIVVNKDTAPRLGGDLDVNDNRIYNNTGATGRIAIEHRAGNYLEVTEDGSVENLKLGFDVANNRSHIESSDSMYVAASGFLDIFATQNITVTGGGNRLFKLDGTRILNVRDAVQIDNTGITSPTGSGSALNLTGDNGVVNINNLAFSADGISSIDSTRVRIDTDVEVDTLFAGAINLQNAPGTTSAGFIIKNSNASDITTAFGGFQVTDQNDNTSFGIGLDGVAQATLDAVSNKLTIRSSNVNSDAIKIDGNFLVVTGSDNLITANSGGVTIDGSSGGQINIATGAGTGNTTIGNSGVQLDLVSSTTGSVTTGAIEGTTITATTSFEGDLNAGSVNADVVRADLIAGNLSGSVFADDSSMLIDGVNAKHFGSFVGDLTGSVVSDDSTVIIDGVNGEVVGPVRNLKLLGQTGNVPVDTGTVNEWIEITVNGNTRYIPLYA